MNPTPSRRQGDRPVHWASIVTLNNLELTKQTVSDLLRQDIGNVWVLVIDNGSTDGTPEWVAQAGKENQLVGIFNGSNRGVGPAWNQAAEFVFAQGQSHVLICNNDIRLRPDTYRHLLTPRGGLVTPVNVGNWEKAQVADVHVSFDPYMKGGPDFSCFLVRDWFWEAIGKFPECYWPGYFEDGESHWVARCKGLDAAIFSTGVPYYHMGSQTIKRNPEVAKINSEHFERNKQLYIRRWGGLPGHEVFTVPFNQQT